MNIKKIIKETIDDFDWADEIPATYKLEFNKRYYISTCDGGFNEDEVYEKLVELGIPKKGIWFENGWIRRNKHRAILFFRPRNGNTNSYFGWDTCESKDEYESSDVTEITMDEFMLSRLER